MASSRDRNSSISPVDRNSTTWAFCRFGLIVKSDWEAECRETIPQIAEVNDWWYLNKKICLLDETGPVVLLAFTTLNKRWRVSNKSYSGIVYGSLNPIDVSTTGLYITCNYESRWLYMAERFSQRLGGKKVSLPLSLLSASDLLPVSDAIWNIPSKWDKTKGTQRTAILSTARGVSSQSSDCSYWLVQTK